MSTIETLEEYREMIAGIELPDEIDGRCLNAVFTGGLGGVEGEQVGALISIRHTMGLGLFGPITNTYVKLCGSCVHTQGQECVNPVEAEEFLVTYVESIVRNGDGEAQ